MGTAVPAGSAVESVIAGPNWLCSETSWAGVMVVPLGSSGPVSLVKSLVARSNRVALARRSGSDQADCGNTMIRLVGFSLASGKCFVSAALPAAALVPGGAASDPPKPPGL